jgi:hypothetical protein
LVMSLSKFSESFTLQQGIDEFKQILMTKTTDQDKMNYMIYKLTDFNAHMKVQQMKEQIKMYGVCAEVFEEDLIPFIPKIHKSLEKLMKEENTGRLHDAISEALGSMVYYIMDKLDPFSEQKDVFEN